jgi:hypothetical protein
MTQQEFPMNVQKKTITVGAVILLLLITLFTSCSNTALFASIEKEVKLNDPTLGGTITSMEVVNGNIFVANGYIYQRTGGTGDWNKMAFPTGAENCSEIASDGTWLYARFTKLDKSVFHSVERYDPSSNDWTKVTGKDDIVLIGSGNDRIYAFTGASNVYSAYITQSSGSTIFNSTPIITDITTPTGTAYNYISTTGSVYSWDGTTCTALTGAPSGVTGITHNGTNLYALNSGAAYRYDEKTSAWTSISHSLDSPTTNLAYLGATKNLLLIASGSLDGGFSEIILNSDGSLSSVIGTPGDSSASSVSTDDQSQYESTIGLWAVHRIFAVTTTVPSGNDYVLYASVTHYDNDGLWSYYSDTQKEWNRE